MRCKNCGWDNPDGNVKCEKCNAQLSDYMAAPQTPYYGCAADEYNPRVTVVGGHAPDDFNPKSTALGCLQCGYPIRPTDTGCPMCGHQSAGHKSVNVPEIVKEPEVVKKAAPVGTIIHGLNPGKTESAEKERKKLTGFLVTYSLSPNGDFFPLYEGKNIIGRAESSTIVIQGDTGISERHLSILYRAVDRKFKFKDEQSSNGTFINEELIDDGELKNNDMIRIGTTRLLFMEIPQKSFE